MRTGSCSCLVATGVLQTGGTLDHALGFWFIALCAITFSGMLGAFAEGNIGVAAVLGVLAAGAGLASVAFLSSSTGAQHAAGWVFVISAALAWYVGTGMMLKGAAGQIVLPLFKTDKASNTPGAKPTRAIELEWGEPGVKKGQ